jgi:hypothetical protein
MEGTTIDVVVPSQLALGIVGDDLIKCEKDDAPAEPLGKFKQRGVELCVTVKSPKRKRPSPSSVKP